MPSKEELKAAIHAAFDAAVPGGAEYTKVYASDMKQKNFIVYRSTTVYNYAVGLQAGQHGVGYRPDRRIQRCGHAGYAGQNHRRQPG